MLNRFVAAILSVIAFSGLQAQDGTFDNTFGVAGINTVSLTEPIINTNSFPISSVLLPDGKIVTCCTTLPVAPATRNIVLMRMNSNGTPDLTFGTGGKVIIDLGGDEHAVRIKRQTDGKFVVAGSIAAAGSVVFTVMRFNPDGSFDNSFDGDGYVTTTFGGSSSFAYGVLIQPDGKIVACGYTINSGEWDAVWARYNTDGSLDNSFDGDGMQTYTAFTGDIDAHDMALQPDGKIVTVAKHRYIPAPPPDRFKVVLYRFNSNGSFDNSFDGDGIAIYFPSATAGIVGHSVKLYSNGKIAVSGFIYDGVCYANMVGRFTGAGAIDNTFGSGGVVSEYLNCGNFPVHQEVFVQPDGKLICVGGSGLGPARDLYISKLTLAGEFDVSFNGTGSRTIDIGGVLNEGHFIVQQPDGKIIVGGPKSNSGVINQMSYMRLNNSVGAPIPVTWLGFAVTKQKEKALLQWSTASEQNNRGFEVQHGTDGIHFSTVGFVNGSGNSNTKTDYSFIHQNPVKGKNYYRLSQTDMDNHSRISHILMLRFEDGLKVEYYPNPVTDILNIQVPDNVVQLVLYDAAGKKLWQQSNSSSRTFTVNTSCYAKGILLLKTINKEGKTESFKLVKE